MKKSKGGFYLTFLLCFCTTEIFALQRIELKSPGEKLKACVFTQNGALKYNVTAGDGRTLIEPSLLGVQCDDLQLGNDVIKITLIKSRYNKVTYEVRGKHSRAEDPYMEYEIEIKEAGTVYRLITRLFENGFAYRYELDAIRFARIKGEQSSFTLPAKARIWFFERNSNWKLKSYAGEWISADIDKMFHVSSSGPVQGKPLIAQLQNGYYLILTEAALYGYSGMRLEATGMRAFRANFTEGPNGFPINNEKRTPWRVIVCASSLNQLVNNDVISSLNPPPDKQLFADQSYIKPGRAVWSWLTHDSSYMKPEKEREFIDYAARLNFEYTLIDEGWEKVWKKKWDQLKAICNYGKTKNVRVWVWKHSDEIRDTALRNDFLDSVAMSGAAGVKVDFMNSEAKELIDFEIGLLKACALRKLMVNFHGCQSPTGESRAFPNELTREGVRGMELNIMEEGPITASHNAALPFTRFAVGHGDYTPGLFSKPGNTTWGQQLAGMYLFDSPFMCLADNPSYIFKEANLKQIVPYLQELPVTWDETVVLDGNKIGELVAFARRKGEVWYVILLNGQNTRKEYILHTSFLRKQASYTTEGINDAPGKSRELVRFSQYKLNQHSSMTFNLEPNGGSVIKINTGIKDK